MHVYILTLSARCGWAASCREWASLNSAKRIFGQQTPGWLTKQLTATWDVVVVGAPARVAPGGIQPVPGAAVVVRLQAGQGDRPS